jgi:hypothetical protein
MIHINSDLAKWTPAYTSEDGEQMGSMLGTIKGATFRAWIVDGKARSEADAIPGTTSSYDVCDLAIRTSNELGASIRPDDAVEWQGFSYSVSTTKVVRSRRRIGAKDYIIYLRGGR